MKLDKLFWGTFALIIAVSLIIVIIPVAKRASIEDKMLRFTSASDMEKFLKDNTLSYSGGSRMFDSGIMMSKSLGAMAPTAAAGESISADLSSNSEYSQTNIQVEGVDEADSVKTDGTYIYTISGNKVVIVMAYPAEDAEKVAEINFDHAPLGMYVNKDRLAVIYQSYEAYEAQPADEVPAEPGSANKAAMMPYYRPSLSRTVVEVFDISDIENPDSIKKASYTGYYFNSRMIDGIVYVISNQNEFRYPLYEARVLEDGSAEVPKQDYVLPEEVIDGEVKKIPVEDIYYLPYPDYNFGYTNFMSVDLNDASNVETKSVLTGTSQQMFVSENNIYLLTTKYNYGPYNGESEKSLVFRFEIDGMQIKYQAKGEVPGHVLNQFSMDEYDGYFRIATTVGHASRGIIGSQPSSSNNVYVLNAGMETVGTLEDLAPGEQIYSARFMGDRCYLVTFKKVDPLFTIDLSDPKNPKVLGKLKIPGYSDYLHPYDEDHIIGVGKGAEAAEEGDFAWYQGVKISIFDVSDIENPKETAKYEIGDRGTSSDALNDHKAFLFDKKRNLLVIPIQLAEIDESKYSEPIPANAYGDIVWQGAYVFDITTDDINLKGRVSHVEDNDSYLKSGYWYNSNGYNIRRSLYIGLKILTKSAR